MVGIHIFEVIAEDGIHNMGDNFQPPAQETHSEIPPMAPQAALQPTPKPNKNLWIIAVAAAGLLCMCSVACLAAIGLGAAGVAGGIVAVFAERAPVEAVLDAYMQAMAAKDVTVAYALFSPRAQRQIPISKFQEMVEGKNYGLFEGYRSLSVQNLNIGAFVNTNPDVPQGTVAKVTGDITYEGMIQGTFNAVLEKNQGVWKLDAMSVMVPPDKIK